MNRLPDFPFLCKDYSVTEDLVSVGQERLILSCLRSGDLKLRRGMNRSAGACPPRARHGEGQALALRKSTGMRGCKPRLRGSTWYARFQTAPTGF